MRKNCRWWTSFIFCPFCPSHFVPFSPNYSNRKNLKKWNEMMEGYQIIILHFLFWWISFIFCPFQVFFFIFCLFHPMKNEEMAMEWWKVVRLWYGYLSFSVLLNIIHFLSISSCKHLILCLCISRVNSTRDAL